MQCCHVKPLTQSLELLAQSRSWDWIKRVTRRLFLIFDDVATGYWSRSCRFPVGKEIHLTNDDSDAKYSCRRNFALKGRGTIDGKNWENTVSWDSHIWVSSHAVTRVACNQSHAFVVKKSSESVIRVYSAEKLPKSVKRCKFSVKYIKFGQQVLTNVTKMSSPDIRMYL